MTTPEPKNKMNTPPTEQANVERLATETAQQYFVTCYHRKDYDPNLTQFILTAINSAVEPLNKEIERLKEQVEQVRRDANEVIRFRNNQLTARDSEIQSLNQRLSQAEADAAAMRDFVMGCVGHYMALDHHEPIENLLGFINENGGKAMDATSGKAILGRLENREKMLKAMVVVLDGLSTFFRHSPVWNQLQASKLLELVQQALAPSQQSTEQKSN